MGFCRRFFLPFQQSFHPSWVFSSFSSVSSLLSSQLTDFVLRLSQLFRAVYTFHHTHIDTNLLQSSVCVYHSILFLTRVCSCMSMCLMRTSVDVLFSNLLFAHLSMILFDLWLIPNLSPSLSCESISIRSPSQYTHTLKRSRHVNSFWSSQFGRFQLKGFLPIINWSQGLPANATTSVWVEIRLAAAVKRPLKKLFWTVEMSTFSVIFSFVID